MSANKLMHTISEPVTMGSIPLVNRWYKGRDDVSMIGTFDTLPTPDEETVQADTKRRDCGGLDVYIAARESPVAMSFVCS
jgi:hypothetical protein